MHYDILEGDNLDIMPTLPAESFDSLVTDPPAGIAFMGKTWDSHSAYIPRTEKAKALQAALLAIGMEPWEAGFVAYICDFGTEALRLLKPGAHGVVWALPRTADLTGLGLRAAGFEVRDSIHHIFGQGFAKSLNASKAVDKHLGAERPVVGTKPQRNPYAGSDGLQFRDAPDYEGEDEAVTAPGSPEAEEWDGFGTGLKPGHEHWILVRKPLSEPTVAANLLRWGVGVLNIDGCRVVTECAKNQGNSSASTAGRLTGPEEAGCCHDSAIELAEACSGEEEKATPSGGLTPKGTSAWSTGTTPADATSTNLSIDESGGRPGETFPKGGYCITSTETRPTIDWTISPLCPGENTPRTTIQNQASTPAEESRQTTSGNTANERPTTKQFMPVRSGNESSVGRWPSNVVFTHHADCRRVGTKIIKGDGHYPEERGPGGLGTAGHVGQTDLQERNLNEETVAAWECVEGCPVKALDEQSGEHPSGSRAPGVRKGMGYHGAEGDGGPEIEASEGGPSRFFPQFEWTEEDAQTALWLYSAKASKSERNAGCQHLYWRVMEDGGYAPITKAQWLRWGEIEETTKKLTGKRPRLRARGNIQPTVKPVNLMRWLCRLVTPPGGKVLEPHGGSGTTLRATEAEGFDCTVIEREPLYISIIKARVGAKAEQARLFG